MSRAFDSVDNDRVAEVQSEVRSERDGGSGKVSVASKLTLVDVEVILECSIAQRLKNELIDTSLNKAIIVTTIECICGRAASVITNLSNGCVVAIRAAANSGPGSLVKVSCAKETLLGAIVNDSTESGTILISSNIT